MKVEWLPPKVPLPAPRFDDLKPGDPFIVSVEKKSLLVKLDPITKDLEAYIDKDMDYQNAVDLETGRKTYVEPTTVVVKVYGHFIETKREG